MQQVTLKRVSTNNDGTYGVLIQDTEAFAVTLEESWNENKPDISCIPAGTYICQRVHSPKFGETFKVMHVPGRSDILFHWGNTEINTTGCILTGSEYGRLKAKDDETNQVEDQPAVLKSMKAFRKFMERFKDSDIFLLQIIWC